MNSFQSERAPASERTAIAPTKIPETMFAPSRTRRRGSRSDSTPPKSSIAMCGSVKASQTSASAVALLEIARVCHPMATYQTPSPSSEMVLADQSSRKSRLAKGARKRLIPVVRRGRSLNTRWSAAVAPELAAPGSQANVHVAQPPLY